MTLTLNGKVEKKIAKDSPYFVSRLEQANELTSIHFGTELSSSINMFCNETKNGQHQITPTLMTDDGCMKKLRTDLPLFWCF